jgi:large conductance mechanosensitive channel
MGFVQEFREFAVKGNVIDMAVGIVLGVAFNKIVTSLVNDLLMPPIGMLLGRTEFKDLMLVLKPAVLTEEGVVVTPEVAIRYGLFANTVVEFFIIAFSVFVVVKAMNRVLRRREAAAAAAS